MNILKHIQHFFPLKIHFFSHNLSITDTKIQSISGWRNFEFLNLLIGIEFWHWELRRCWNISMLHWWIFSNKFERSICNIHSCQNYPSKILKYIFIQKFHTSCWERYIDEYFGVGNTLFQLCHKFWISNHPKHTWLKKF